MKKKKTLQRVLSLTQALWQMERRVEYDVWYIENWTFFLDMKIVVRTVLNAIQGEKNAF